MKRQQQISDEVLEKAHVAISKGEFWIAYNSSLDFLDQEDIYFFRSLHEANEFANNNDSHRDYFNVIPFISVQDLFGKLLERLPHTQVDPDANGLYNKEGNAFTDALLEHIDQQQINIYSQVKLNRMNKENFQYLSDQLKYMGFGEDLQPALEKNLKEGKAEFQLHYQAEINKKPFEVTMNFRKSDSSDRYFFNNYNASVVKADGQKEEQTFYLNKGKGVTGKEAFNLLDGRAVYKDLVTKEGQPYKAWIQLDFENKDKHNNSEVKQFHENYGFDLKAAVEKFAIAELKEPEKQMALLQSLQKGNLQSVTVEKDGSSQRMFVEADPQFKKVNLYDAAVKLVAKESIDQFKTPMENVTITLKESVATDKKKEVKQDSNSSSSVPLKNADKVLLPKKREGKSKNLGLS